jgi:DNA-binding CsgD family transcriptional regulator
MSQIPFSEIQAFSSVCLNAATPEEITRPFDKALRSVGIVSWFVGSMANVSEQKAKGFGYYGVVPDWQARYEQARHYDYDPVFQHALHGTVPVVWSQCRDRARAGGACKRALDVFVEASEFELTDGYIIPVHGFGDLPGAVTLGGHDPDLSSEGRLSLDLICAYAYEGLRRLTDNVKPVAPDLTQRELDVLRWSAEGKTAWEIGRILGIAARTVRSYGDQLKRKYRVPTMIQVAVLAALDGNLRDRPATRHM